MGAFVFMIPITPEIDHESKKVAIRIPWYELVKIGKKGVDDWLERASKLQTE
jgi:hypothetical protein